MNNLTDPSILFFIFGIFAGFVKSNLEIPQPISRFLSLYLLMALAWVLRVTALTSSAILKWEDIGGS